MSEELNSLLEKHKQLQQRSIFKTVCESHVQSNASNIPHPQPQHLQNYYNPLHFLPQENCLHPVTQFSSYQYLQHMPQTSQPYYPYNFVPTILHPHLYTEFSSSMQPPLPPLPPESKPPAPSPPSSGKVYVNPNYNRKIAPGNSNVQSNSSIYINPKLMQNTISPQISNLENNYVFNKSKNYHGEEEHSTCVEKTLDPCVSKTTESVKKDLISSSYTANLSSTAAESDSDITVIDVNEPLKSRILILSKNSPINVTEPETIVVKNNYEPKENTDSNLLILSRRKLVRIQKNSEKKLTIPFKTLTKRKISISDNKKTKISQKKLTSQSSIKLLKVKSPKSTRSDWYNRISPKKKLLTKTNLNNTSSLVSIGGIEYKTSKNKLIRNSLNDPAKKCKKNSSSKTSQKCYDVETGAELIEVKLSESKSDHSFDSLEKLNLSGQNFKTSVSNKVKQRCLQILRKKLSKTNQHCLFFQKYGYCANQLTCSKIHDKKLVAVCGNFLQGKCFLENCLLSHQKGPEKMPTCKYFLEGCCSRDNCPYLHVKVPSKNPICVEFLQGYCPKGDECLKRHIHACPEFDRTGKCRKGKYCPYPHKSILLNNFNSYKKSTQCKSSVFQKKHSETKPTGIQKNIYRKRYYENSSEDLNQKKKKSSECTKFTKNNYLGQISNSSEIKDSEFKNKETVNNAEESEENLEDNTSKPRRSPIGPLPAYIPIE